MSARVIPLGGLGEVGMNCMAIEDGDELILIDCGVTFPDHNYGVDVHYPRFDYLYGREDQITALVLTHGHEDHIGAIPYLFKELGRTLPIYGPPYALYLVGRRLEEHGYRDVERTQLPLSAETKIGAFGITPLRVNHSIVDATSLAIATSSGIIVHSGDFKIERNPTGEPFDYDGFKALGDRGVQLLMSDSTNIDVPGRTKEEHETRGALLDEAKRAKGRLVIAQFASNGHRMKIAFEVAKETGRKVCLLGRSLQNHYDALSTLGHLENTDSMLVAPEYVRSIPRHELCVLATGTQGESRATIARLARNDHRHLSLEEGDTVVFSSRIIPGCELQVYEMNSALERLGVHVRHQKTSPGVHVSGHAARDEQREMIEMLRPKMFMPIHGTYHHLKNHAALAKEVGVQETIIVENGSVVEVREDSLKVVDMVDVGVVPAAYGERIEEDLIRQRRLLGEFGHASLVIFAREEEEKVDEVHLRSAGCINPDDEDDLLDDAEDYILSRLRRYRWDDFDALEEEAVRAARRFFRKRTRRSPWVTAMAIAN